MTGLPRLTDESLLTAGMICWPSKDGAGTQAARSLLMLIKTIEDFRKLCKRWEDAFADSFDESRLISKIGKVTKYATFYRDESNNKCIAVLMWDPCTRHADLEAEYP